MQARQITLLHRAILWPIISAMTSTTRPLILRRIAASFAVVFALHAGAAPANSQPISEQQLVPIGGIDQWITITGEDRDNPVVLFLHGGPGSASSPWAESLTGSWERDVTVVHWDQRGAGRTLRASGPSIEPTMTVERMVDDGIEVSEYLIRHLHQKKIILVGASWGAILGVQMVKKKPALFCAYVGSAQTVNMRENIAAGYERTLQLARSGGNQTAINDLTGLGIPPWNSLRQMNLYFNWVQRYEAQSSTQLHYVRSADYSSAQDLADAGAAQTLAFTHFFGRDLDGPIMHVDLPALGTDFSIPIFMVQGEEDIRASPQIARAYFDSIKAPQKRFFLVPKTAHEFTEASVAMIHDVLIKEVRPACARAR